jgi:outer membrane protein OmpA-like peptidoglycan-associated protein
MKLNQKNLWTSTLVVAIVSGLAFSGCASDQKNTMKGAGIGVAAGAVAGAIIGHQSGNREKGAIAGALLGGAIGGYVGNRMDKQAKELEKIAETKRTEQGLVTKLKSDILFDTGKSDLKPQAQANLKQMAEIMKKYPENVLTIKGYTDSTGSASVNTSLSQKRADAVKNALVSSGMPADTISTLGEGPASPIGDNKTEAGRKQNRRVEIEVTVDESKVPKQK